MKPYEFEYLRPSSLEEALQMLAEHGEEAKLLAGGQSLLATLNMRLSAPAYLVDIGNLEEMNSIHEHDGMLRIGGLCRHAEIQASSLVGEHVPLLHTAIEHVAHAAIRNRGTHGGSIAFADPAAEIPACVVALDASLTLCSAEKERRVQAGDFFKDLYETDLAENEIVKYIDYPLGNKGSVFAFREFARRKGDFATAGLALHGEMEDGVVTSLRPVFFGVGNSPQLAVKVSELLKGQKIEAGLITEARNLLGSDIEIIGDVYAGSAMKQQLCEHFLTQTLEEIAELV